MNFVASPSQARLKARDMIVSAFSSSTRLNDFDLLSENTKKWKAEYGHHYEGAEVERMYAGKAWSEVDAALLEACNGGFSYLSTKARAYFLPAIIVMVIDRSWDAPGIVFDGLFTDLDPDFPSPATSVNREVLGYFSEAQKVAVAEFLDVMAHEEWTLYSENEAQRLLDGYWGKFLHG